MGGVPCHLEGMDQKGFSVRTELFRIHSRAQSHCVWDALTTIGKQLDYLYGLVIRAEWIPGSPLFIGPPAGPQLTGRVLRVDEGHRLSYAIGDGADQSVYVTWELDAVFDGTIVRLYVDEPATQNTSADLEMAWSPVMSMLQMRLEACSPRGPAVT